MTRHVPFTLLLVMLASGFTACSFSETNMVELPRNRTVIVDVDGKEWDVTSAVYDYDMALDGFHHGLGKDAIPPLIAPSLISVGDEGFPKPEELFSVVGTSVGDDVRAYGIWDIRRFEVVDEIIGDAPVAVAY